MAKNIHIHLGKKKTIDRKVQDTPKSKYSEWVIKVTWDPVLLGGKSRQPSYYKFDHNPNMNEVHSALEKQGFLTREIDRMTLYSKK